MDQMMKTTSLLKMIMLIIKNNQPFQPKNTCRVRGKKVHAEPAKSRYSQIIRPKTIMIKICDARTMKSQNLTLCSIIEDCNMSLNVEPYDIADIMDNLIAQ